MTGPGATAPVRVLVADDDADQRLLLRRLLSRAGFDDVVEAADGHEALAAAVAHTPDLILLDLAMPGRSGVEVLPDLHDQVPTARVVVLSNLPRGRLGSIVRDRGAVGYVEKRVDPDRLVHEVLVAAALTERAAARASTRLPAAAAAAGAARAFIRDTLDGPDRALLAEVELLVSELVTNAVLHASSAPRVDVVLAPQHVRVEVQDDDPDLPVLRAQTDPDTIGGRGILLIDRMASRWGAEARDDGKVVWFELDRPGPAPGGITG
ncbi:MAG TPA: response regulator [Acidimicrobiales bacterium]|nr:response regulator [Acidimicrobiales bacterium]